MRNNKTMIVCIRGGVLQEIVSNFNSEGVNVILIDTHHREVQRGIAPLPYPNSCVYPCEPYVVYIEGAEYTVKDKEYVSPKIDISTSEAWGLIKRGVDAMFHNLLMKI